ncbi:acyl-CoA N-acyltransferase [Lichtheimia hyalospora FSU 10163]|nr:acyl-CoA N-acyltransferase [Lichtheimia hyalospora FSU 10163]
MTIDLIYEPAKVDDVDVITALETESYHPDEAASREQLVNRIQYALTTDANLFMVARRSSDRELVGFVCTTLSKDSLVTDESMKTHDPQGKTVCLHSVCVSPNARRQKIASRLMKHWIEVIRNENRYQRIALLSRHNLIPLYESVGFKTLGKSLVVHGPDPWYDAVIDF